MLSPGTLMVSRLKYLCYVCNSYTDVALFSALFGIRIFSTFGLDCSPS